MSKYKLSIIIPARNEMFLTKTIEDLLEHKTDDTEIIAGLDGEWADPVIPDHEDVSLLYYPESIGQRAISNQLCKLSDAKYIMKADGHCAFEQNFDKKMIEAMEELGDNITMVPIMRNLHAFNWVCSNSHVRYQGPSGPCKHELAPGVECGKETTKDVVWIAKTSPQSTAYSFDPTPHFQYFGELKKRQVGDFPETMSLQGSCFMLTRAKYWELDICSEDFGSWGSQGIEVACKTWLSGGRVVVNKKTWYAHMFRTQGGDFGFPYHQRQSKVNEAKTVAKKMFFDGEWKGAVRPLSWLVERFWPITHWTEDDLERLKGSKRLTKGIIYYTDNQLNLKIAHAVQRQLREISETMGIPIVSSSLKPMERMGKNIHLSLKRGRLTMMKQILATLEASTSDIVFFCEHDVLYPPSHFDAMPNKDEFLYNQNWWKIRPIDDLAIHYDANQLSGLCCYRDFAIKEYKERVRRIEESGWKNSIGYEPGTRNIGKGGISDYGHRVWKSETPMIDIKHEGNLTKQRWNRNQFKNQKNCEGWLETTRDKIKGWNDLDKLF